MYIKSHEQFTKYSIRHANSIFTLYYKQPRNRYRFLKNSYYFIIKETSME